MIAFEAFVDILTGHVFCVPPDGSKSISHVISIVVSQFIFPNECMGQFKVCVCAMSDLMPRRLVKLVFLSSKFAAVITESFQQNGADVNNMCFTEYVRSFTKIIEVLVTVSNDRINCV